MGKKRERLLNPEPFLSDDTNKSVSKNELNPPAKQITPAQRKVLERFSRSILEGSCHLHLEHIGKTTLGGSSEFYGTGKMVTKCSVITSKMTGSSVSHDYIRRIHVLRCRKHIQKVSIPPLHFSLALMKLAEMEYGGTTSCFIKLLVEKKYALPYRVIDAMVAHFRRFCEDSRCKHEPTKEQKDYINYLVKKQRRKMVTPEILRELNHSRNRGEKEDDLMSISSPISVISKTIDEDRFDIPDVPMEED